MVRYAEDWRKCTISQKRQFTMLILRNMVYIGVGKIFYKHSYEIRSILFWPSGMHKKIITRDRLLGASINWIPEIKFDLFHFLFDFRCSENGINKNISTLKVRIETISFLAAQFARATQLVLLHCYYCFTFTCFIYILANYYLLPLNTLNPLFTANRWDWQPHCKLGQSTWLCCEQVPRCC
jgi:hypothetical protein